MSIQKSRNLLFTVRSQSLREQLWSFSGDASLGNLAKIFKVTTAPFFIIPQNCQGSVFWPQIKLFRLKLIKTSDLQVCLLIQSDTNCNFKFKIRLNERKSIVNQTKKNEIQKKLLIKQIIYKHILATDTSCSM